MNDQYARLFRNIQNAAAPIKTERPAMITQVVKNEQGLAVSAVATVGDETNVKVRLAQGIGTITHVGETWWATLEGGATGTWKLTECINSRFLRIADQTDYEMPTPQIPTVSLGGIYTESAQAGVGTPNANPDPQTANADAYIYYQSIVPGSYSVFDQGIKQVVYQIREESFEEWGRTQVADLYPNRKVELTLSGSVTSSGTAFPVSGASSYAGYLFDEQPALWRVESEVILGIYAAGTIRVVEHNGAGSAVRGQGFVTSTGGRGLPQGGSASAHPSGAVVELLSGQVTLPGLRPGTNYEVHLAFANQASRPGPWSAVQSFTSWSQEVQPSAPSNLTVAHLSSGISVTWDKVITDVDGNVRTDIRRYAVARHTAALAGTLTFAAVAALATIFAGTVNPISNVGAVVPATQGYGNYIGVAAISDGGLLSDWSWADDDLAPPYPAPGSVTITSIPNGVFVSIPPGANSINAQTGGTIASPAQLDPGFYQFVLWRSSASNGTAAVPVGYASSTDFPIYMQGGVTGYYKVTAMDRAGNMNGPATYPANTQKAGESNANTNGFTSNWQFVWARHIENTFPANGNFQDVIGDESAPRYWTVGGDPVQPGAGIAITFDSTAGVNGNRAWKITTTNYGGPGGFVELTSTRMPAPAAGTPTVSFWVMSPTTARFMGEDFTPLGTVPAISIPELTLAAYNSSGTLIGEYPVSINPVGGTVSLTANTWKKVSFVGTTTPTAGIGTTAIDSVELKFQIWAGAYANGYSSPVSFVGYVDSVEVTWN